MRVSTAFAPITIVVESVKEYQDLQEILRVALHADRRWGGNTERSEKIEHLMRQLGMNK